MNPSVKRVIDVLDYIAENHTKKIGITIIAKALDMPKSTASGILYSLVELGYLDIDSESGKYFTLGKAAIRFGVATIGQNEMVKFARDGARKLQEKTGYTVLVGIRTQDKVIYLHKEEENAVIRIADGVGTTKPLHLTAIGKVLLSGLTDDQILDVMGDTCYNVHTKNSIMNQHALINEIQNVRKCGYAIENFEDNDYIYGIAAPIHDANENVVSGIGVCIMKDHLPEKEKIIETIKVVKDCANFISSSLGYRKEIEL